MLSFIGTVAATAMAPPVPSFDSSAILLVVAAATLSERVQREQSSASSVPNRCISDDSMTANGAACRSCHDVLCITVYPRAASLQTRSRFCWHPTRRVCYVHNADTWAPSQAASFVNQAHGAVQPCGLCWCAQHVSHTRHTCNLRFKAASPCGVWSYPAMIYWASAPHRSISGLEAGTCRCLLRCPPSSEGGVGETAAAGRLGRASGDAVAWH